MRCLNIDTKESRVPWHSRIFVRSRLVKRNRYYQTCYQEVTLSEALAFGGESMHKTSDTEIWPDVQFQVGSHRLQKSVQFQVHRR